MDGTILNKKYDLAERVKALEEAGSSLPDYSTEEHKTGQKWIDGKDLYQKTLQITITSTSEIYPHGIENVDTIFINNSATFFVSNGTTENFYSAGYDDRGDYANGYNKIIQSVNSTGVAIKAQSNTIVNLVAIVTLNYTKTESEE